MTIKRKMLAILNCAEQADQDLTKSYKSDLELVLTLF